MSKVKLSRVPKSLRPTVADAVGRGWVLERTRKQHLKLSRPGCGPIIIGSTPSEYRTLKNLEADIKRAERTA